MSTVRCVSCGTDNPEPEGGAPFFCRQCHEIVDPGGKRKSPPPTAPPPRAPNEGATQFVSQYKTTAPTYEKAPGAGFSVAGSRPVGYVFAAVAAAVAGVGLGWIGLNYVNVPILFSLLAGWGIKRALAAGSGGGTPDRGAIGFLVLLGLVLATFGAGRYVEYLTTARNESPRYGLLFGSPYSGDVEATVFDLRARDPDRDGVGTLPDATTYRVVDEEQRIRAAVATGIHPKDGYDIALLAETGRAGFLGHVQHVVSNGMSFRFTPRGRAFPLDGYVVFLWWFLELVVLGLAAFSRVE